MDWHSRKVLGWAVSNTMGTALCLEALEKALGSTGKVPEIFNTDQGCQFTSAEWTGRLTSLGVAISMDGRGRWMDNVFIERLWRSVKYEKIYLKKHATIPELRCVLSPPFRLPDFESLATPSLNQLRCSPIHLPHPTTIASFGPSVAGLWGPAHVAETRNAIIGIFS